jgi:hypothetical protein
MVMVGIVPSRYSYPLIKESGCFVVNLVDRSYQETFDYLGSHSKRDGDKLAEAKVRLEEGKKVAAPILPDCPVNIECTIVDSIVTAHTKCLSARSSMCTRTPACSTMKARSIFHASSSFKRMIPDRHRSFVLSPSLVIASRRGIQIDLSVSSKRNGG